MCAVLAKPFETVEDTSSSRVMICSSLEEVCGRANLATPFRVSSKLLIATGKASDVKEISDVPVGANTPMEISETSS